MIMISQLFVRQTVNDVSAFYVYNNCVSARVSQPRSTAAAILVPVRELHHKMQHRMHNGIGLVY